LKIVVFGSTGGTGRQLVQQTLQQGHAVTAFARDPGKIKLSHENLRVVKGNVLDFDSVKAVLQGQDATLSALGVRPPVWQVISVAIACQLVARFAGLSGSLNLLVRLGVPLVVLFLSQRKIATLSEGTKNILRGMEELRVRRFICESSLGVGDSRGQLGAFANYFFIPLFLRNIFADKEIQEKAIKETQVEWVIVRPAVLTNGRLTGKYQSWLGIPERHIRRKISRADTADFMLRQLTDNAYLRKTPGLSY
jgi:putative NADH-flavin reductase